MKKPLIPVLTLLFTASLIFAAPQDLAEEYASKAINERANPTRLKSFTEKARKQIRKITNANQRDRTSASIAHRFFNENLLEQGIIIGQEIMNAVNQANTLSSGAIQCAASLKCPYIIKCLKLIKSLPVRFRVLQNLSVHYAGQGKFDEAITTAGNISRTYVLYADAMSQIAVLMARNVDLEKGLAFAKSLPRNSISQNKAYAEIAQYCAESVSYERCFSITALIPGGSEFITQVYMFVIRLQIKRDELDKARLTLDRFVKRSYAWRTGVFELACAYVEKGNHDKALELGGLLPNGAMQLFELQEKIAYAYFEKGEEEMALNLIKEIVVADIRNRALTELAKRYQQKGDTVKALETAMKISHKKARDEAKELIQLGR